MVAKGTIVRVEYDAWADGQLFDTTSAETAQAQNKHHEEAYYGPLPIIVGAGRVVQGFDKALEQASVGEEREVEVAPEEGFGIRDPTKVETLSIREFQKRDVDPTPGMRVEWEGKGRGTIQSVTAGRVRVDFNPVLAGKTLKYKFKVLDTIEEPAAKVRAIIDGAYGYGQGEGFQVKVDDLTTDIVVPDKCKFDARWISRKYVVVADLRRYAGFTKIRFVEEYEPPEPPPEPEPQATVEEQRAEEELTEEDRAEVERQLASRRKAP
jgi:FKBP-type peptidyl-prolyl cis-trans isomerase 2